MRKTLEIRGARENNLKGVDVIMPRNKLVVLTGVSGSGKSSLAFETIYAEGQRRLMASMSTYARRFMQQLKRPKVDFLYGLSPVISIEQKTITQNPRSTVGTLTDLWDYLRMLYATIGKPHCPYCTEELRVLSPQQISERLLNLPEQTSVEIRGPVFKIYGEDYEYLFEHVRTNGYRRMYIDGELCDLGEELKLDESLEYRMEVLVDSFVVEKGIDRHILAALEHGIKFTDNFLSFHVAGDAEAFSRFYADFGCSEHKLVCSQLHHGNFTFNDPAGACVTCTGLGKMMRVYPELLVPDPSLSLWEGAILPDAFRVNSENWNGRILYTLSRLHGFSLDEPYSKLPQEIVDLLLYGNESESFKVEIPPTAKKGHHYEGREISFSGVVNRLEAHYRWYLKQGSAHSEDYFRKIMVEDDCPDCQGARIRRSRQLVQLGGMGLHEVGELHLQDLFEFLKGLELPEHHQETAKVVLSELYARLELLLEIGLDYLNLNRRSATLSGGESQRIRLSSQIGSGLMGMLYVLDEPSIGLHAKDNRKMISTLRRLRDLGNTVIVVEHDTETIESADFVVEMGPGPGRHGGEVVVAGTLEDVRESSVSLTGRFLRGEEAISLPAERRKGNGKFVRVEGARENNLRDIDVDFPLGLFACVTGASGSGKSSLVHEILFKKLTKLLVDTRARCGDHDTLAGFEHIDNVIHIDQAPIGRQSRSNPATYIGFYDNIRKLFAKTEQATKRGYTASRFSFNVKGGRCEECAGEGKITTHLSFMPEVEVLCPTCKGARYNHDTLEILYRGKSIAEVLEMSLEESLEFFGDQKGMARKLKVLVELGLGYLRVGHPAPILSGGEAQRIKLAAHLGKLKRGKHNLYILDEPTTGLHMADIQRLLDSLNRLVDAGHTVLVIEHNLDVIKCADWVIDLGPEGGHKGGLLLVCGTPEDVAVCDDSYTGRFLKKLLEKPSDS
jgi:excinuclease ABC subunit A